MGVGAEYKAEYEKVKKLLEELRAARENENTPEDQWVELNGAIDAYEAKLAELEATGPSITDQILRKYYPEDNMPWDPEVYYIMDNVVEYKGKLWKALSGVKLGVPPSDDPAEWILEEDSSSEDQPQVVEQVYDFSEEEEQ